LLCRVAARFGEALEGAPEGLARVFPSAARVADLAAVELSSLGILPARARTLVALAGAIASGALDLRVGADVDAARAGLKAIPGIGPWTTEYIAMRALGWPDAFPAGDLVVLKALGETRPARAAERSEAWRPWRAYAVMHLWRGAA
jgi:AraC family transcriptional regulator of adaptative response / DNA-3-methyladenine glycosylase II